MRISRSDAKYILSIKNPPPTFKTGIEDDPLKLLLELRSGKVPIVLEELKPLEEGDILIEFSILNAPEILEASAPIEKYTPFQLSSLEVDSHFLSTNGSQLKDFPSGSTIEIPDFILGVPDDAPPPDPMDDPPTKDWDSLICNRKNIKK